MTPYDFPLYGTLMSNPNKIPSFKKGYFIGIIRRLS